MEKSKKLMNKLFSRGREFLGVEYPILGGAMSWISEAKLVSAISNAGGFGVLAGGNMPIDLFKEEIRKTSELTDKPFGVNLITIAPNFNLQLDHALDIEFPYIIFAGGLPPRDAISRVRQTSSKILCFAPTVGLAKTLIKMGVDALIIEGHEAGGHIGPVSTSVLAEQILPHTKEVPVFIAGGIGSGLLMIHYLMMGASGVQLGTRFVIAEESIAHKNFKNEIIKASSKDAIPCAQFDPRVPVIPVRAIVNEGAKDFTTLQLGLLAQIERGEMNTREAGEKLETFWIGGLRKAVIEGDVINGSLMAGQSVGLATKIMPVKDIINELIEKGIEETDRILKLVDISD
ncbi:MAG: nitronate monooxygenase [Spirochaetaceae bacterium]|nr:nitronate monooxygenase [Spirochaetaceae bacterium]